MKNLTLFAAIALFFIVSTGSLPAQSKAIYGVRNLPGTEQFTQLIRIDPSTGVFDVVSGTISANTAVPPPLFPSMKIIWDGGATAYAIEGGKLYSFAIAGSQPQEIGTFSFNSTNLKRFANYEPNKAFTRGLDINLTTGVTSDVSGGKAVLTSSLDPTSKQVIRSQITSGANIAYEMYDIPTGNVTDLGTASFNISLYRSYKLVGTHYYLNNQAYAQISPSNYSDRIFVGHPLDHTRYYHFTVGQADAPHSGPLTRYDRVVAFNNGQYVVKRDNELRLVDIASDSVLSTIPNFPAYVSQNDGKRFIASQRIENTGAGYATVFTVNVINDTFTGYTTTEIRANNDDGSGGATVRGGGDMFPEFGTANVISVSYDDAANDVIILYRDQIWRVDVATGDRTLVREFENKIWEAGEGQMVTLTKDMRPPSVLDYVNMLTNINPMPEDVITPDRNEDGALDVGDLTTRQIEVQRLP
jgi:hypothetical protein